jgi:hypothetical protein
MDFRMKSHEWPNSSILLVNKVERDPISNLGGPEITKSKKISFHAQFHELISFSHEWVDSKITMMHMITRAQNIVITSPTCYLNNNRDWLHMHGKHDPPSRLE